MKATVRMIIGVLAGMALWGVLWNSGTALAQRAFPGQLSDVETITHVGLLIAYIAYSVVLSALAGFVTAASAGPRAVPAVYVLAGIHQILGIMAQVSYWDLMPIWYHLVFLALVIPATVLGGRLRSRAAR